MYSVSAYQKARISAVKTNYTGYYNAFQGIWQILICRDVSITSIPVRNTGRITVMRKTLGESAYGARLTT